MAALDPYIHIFRPELTLNGQQLQLYSPQHSYTYSRLEKVTLTDATGETFLANVETVSGVWPQQADHGDFLIDDVLLQIIEVKFRLEGSSQNASAHGFGIEWTTDPTHQLQSIGTSVDERGHSSSIQLTALRGNNAGKEGEPDSVDPDSDAKGHGNDGFDIEAEVEALIGLQEQAKYLEKAMAHKRKSLYKHVRQYREQVRLGDLVKQCDSVVCATKVIAQRICDKVHDIADKHRTGYIRLHDSQMGSQATLAAGHSSLPKTYNCTFNKDLPLYAMEITACKDGVATAQSTRDPLWYEDESTSPHLKGVNIVGNTSPLVRALEIIAGILGLGALFAVIRSKCISMRTKVERAADREERRNARAYRRAARRAEMQKRWGQFKSAFSCFGIGDKGGRHGDYEEKRGLIVQEAFMESDADADLAEKGEIMEAEIRELRNVHNIVANMVQCDPPPSRVPLPRHLHNTINSNNPSTRNSRSSTTTLPSYTSKEETSHLPSYDASNSTSQGQQNCYQPSTPPTTFSPTFSTSPYPPSPYDSTTPYDPDNSDSSSTSSTPVNGFQDYVPTTSNNPRNNYLPPALRRQRPETSASSISEGSTRTSRVSSVLELSTRCSDETLRTDRSGSQKGGERKSN
ncbi:hypothetical protein MBLNU230_g5032t1 [Neophaeotheca triangularis]